MGFLEPSPPPFDLEEWKGKPHLSAAEAAGAGLGRERLRLADLRLLPLRPQAGRLQRRGAGRDLADARARLARRPRDWWTEPIVFQKLAVWTLLWEILGLGAGSMPLSFRFSAADRRAALLAAARDRAAAAVARQGAAHARDDAHAGSTSCSTRACSPRASSCSAPPAWTGPATSAGKLPPAGIAVLLGLLGLLGLRDKVSFLGARPEIYVHDAGRRRSSRSTSGSSPGSSSSSSSGGAAASSKLNQPLPLRRLGDDQQRAAGSARSLKRRLWRDYPEDMRPSRLAGGDRPLRHRAGVPLARCC